MSKAKVSDRIHVGYDLFTAIKADPELPRYIEVMRHGPAIRLCGTPIVPNGEVPGWSMEAFPEGTYCDAWFKIHDVLRAHLHSATPPVEG